MRLMIRSSELFALCTLVIGTLFAIAVALLLVPLALLGAVLFGLFSLFTHIEVMLRKRIIMNDNAGEWHSLSRSTATNAPIPTNKPTQPTVKWSKNGNNLPN